MAPSTKPTGDRTKALETALASIEKNFGKGSVMRAAGDAPVVEIETISTGSLGLDLALGVGGLPRGRIVEIYGPESSGKCLTAGTYMLTKKGMVTIDELFEMEGFKATCTTRIVPHEVDMVNEKGEWETTSHLTWNNRKPIKRITTSLGTTLEATHNHPVRVMDANGFVVWKHAGELEEGDHLVVMRGQEKFPENDVITVEEATLLGYLIADGANAEKNRVHFSNSDPDVIADYTRLIGVIAPEETVRSYPHGGGVATIDHHVHSVALRSDLEERLGLAKAKSAQKTVPLTVRASSARIQHAFLRAYLELECSIATEARVFEVSSASKHLLEQVQLMLLNFGFVGTLSHKPVDGTSYWRLVYSGAECGKIAQWAGFVSAARQASVTAIAETTQVHTNIDSVPHLAHLIRSLYDSTDMRSREADRLLGDVIGDRAKAKVTYHRLEKIVGFFESGLGADGHPLLTHLRGILDDRHFFAKVSSVEDDTAPTFDVCLPGTHSFWSNGLVSHNTTLTLHVLAEAQKAGLTCAFIDAEHALDVKYAASLGVQLDELLISQPDTGEQALNIADTLARSGAVDVIIVDSVAALIPEKELEGDVGDSQVGVQARMMSQGMRKLTGPVHKNNVLMIFINQIRMKIGVMFGSPETTTGGNALKFYASVRLDIRRTGSVKEKDVAIANSTRVKVVKNKVAPPFREANFDIEFGKGISKMGEVVDLGVAAGVVEKSGSWFSYNSERIGQGRENAKTFLLNNPAIAADIEAQIRANAAGLPLVRSSGGDE